MRIGMILDNEYLTDARVPNEARYLVRNGHEVFVLCINFDNRSYFETVDGVHVVRFDMKRRSKNRLFGVVNLFPLYNWIWAVKIKHFIVKYKIEALHAHDLYMSKPVYMANLKFNLPITLDLHENYPAAITGYTWANKFPHKILVLPSRWKKKEKRYLLYANNIVVLSEAFRQTLCEEYPSLQTKRFVVYPNVPDAKWFLSVPVDCSIRDSISGFVLLYFGVIGIRRGMVTCFEAMKKLIINIHEIKLLLIGPVDRSDRELFDCYLNDPTIKDNIIYLPWIDLKELPSYINASDVCLAPFINSPHIDSGISNKVFQYMLFERPVVLSDSKPHKMIVDETGCGHIFKDVDVNDFVNVILKMYNNPEVRKEMGTKGKKAILEKYNLEKTGKALEDLYRKEQGTNSRLIQPLI